MGDHDNLFHTAFSSPKGAAGLLAGVLPAELVRRIDLASLAPRSTKFTGPHLLTRHSDLLFAANLEGREVLIYVLIEHQSTNEPFMLVRLLLYMALTWDGYVRDEKPARYLPPILPVVVHHSEGGWSAATRFEDVIDPAALELEGMLRYIPRFEMLLDDLSKATDEDLQRRGQALAQSLVLWALRDARNSERFFAHFRAWAKLLDEVAADPSEQRVFKALLRYISSVLGADWADQLRQLLLELAPATERAMQTIAESWEQKGIEKGIEKGRVEGRVEGLQELVRRLLTKKFGPLTESILERLGAATAPELQEYADRILDAQQLADIFEG